MDRREAFEAATSLQDLLVARATGGSAGDTDYREIRELFVNSAEYHDLLPTFVRTSRSIDQFWAHIKKASSGYGGRREHIWQAFDPLLRYLESEPPPGQIDPPRPLAAVSPPTSLRGPIKTRGFISYSTTDKSAAAAVKRALSTVGIECFMAHEDIEVSEEWRERILEELAACELFIPLLSESFKRSDWAPQEIGAIALRPEVAVVPLSLDGTIPYGFLAKIQSAKVPPTGIAPESILEPLTKRHPRIALPALICRVRDATGFRYAEAAMQPLVPHFGVLTNEEAVALAKASLGNGQVWAARYCRDDYLPEFIRLCGHRIPAEILRALKYQVEHQEWYHTAEA